MPKISITLLFFLFLFTGLAFSSSIRTMVDEEIGLMLEGKTIVIDPGHGGAFTGTAYPLGGKADFIERDVVLEISKKIKSELESKGAKVFLTRESNETNPKFSTRRNTADVPNSILISIHLNGSNNSSAKGIEIIYDKRAVKQEESKKLGEAIIEELKPIFYEVRGKGLKDVKEVGKEELSVLYSPQSKKNPLRPSILIEAGFLTNPSDRIFLSNDLGREKIAKAISEGIQEYFSAKSNMTKESIAAKSSKEKIAVLGNTLVGTSSGTKNTVQKEFFSEQQTTEKRIVKITEEEQQIKLENISDTNKDLKPVYIVFLPFGEKFSPEGLSIVELKKIFWGADYLSKNRVPLGSKNLDFCGAYSVDGNKELEIDFAKAYGNMTRVCFKENTFEEKTFSIKILGWNKKEFAFIAAQDNGKIINRFDEGEITKMFYRNALEKAEPVIAQRTQSATKYLAKQSKLWGWDVADDECETNYCDSEQFMVSQIRKIQKVINRGLSQEEEQKLVKTYAFLKEDGFSEDFFSDFKKSLSEKIFEAPEWFKGKNGLGEFFSGKIKIVPEKITNPGLYQVISYFESANQPDLDASSPEGKLLSETLKEQMFFDGKPNGTIIIELKKIKDAESVAPWLRIPVDGSLGLDGHRNGYGSLVADGPAIVWEVKSNGEKIVIPLALAGSNPVQWIHSKETYSSKGGGLSIKPTGSYSIILDKNSFESVGEAIESQGEMILADENNEEANFLFSNEELGEIYLDESEQTETTENQEEQNSVTQNVLNNENSEQQVNSQTGSAEQKFIFPFKTEFLIVIIVFVLLSVAFLLSAKKWNKENPKRRRNKEEY
ncbi:MAG: N-acetylmuramoyl-L-alanine amidase [archaeon]